MTLDECIAYFEEQSKEHTKLVPYDVDEKYNKNCKQLAEWLRELKFYRTMIPSASEYFRTGEVQDEDSN